MNIRRRLAWAGGYGFGLLLTVAAGSGATAEAKGQQSQQPAAQTGNSANAEPSNNGFAIESEMLTYSAMDADGSAVACNVARSLGAADDKCAPRGTSDAAGVAIVTGDSNALAEFQLWRGDISTMDILTRRASRYCPQQNQRGLISSVESLLSGFPVGQAMSVAKALFTTTSVTTLLGGNILDQTLMNDVAGHLRTAGVVVVIPDTYMPHSLVTINEARSPFLSKFLALMNARGCLDVTAGQAPEPAKPPTGAAHPAPAPDRQSDVAADRDKESIARAIDQFLDSLTEPGAAAQVAAQAEGAAAAPPAPAISHLNAVMRADGLAQELGFDATNNNTGDNSPWVVLWLKALESGGDEVASDNLIKGSKTNYTGGAVGTFALFHLNGELACSGAVFDLAGPVLLTDIPKFVDATETAPAARLVGGCAPVGK
jgi:hypothetical protein